MEGGMGLSRDEPVGIGGSYGEQEVTVFLSHSPVPMSILVFHIWPAFPTLIVFFKLLVCTYFTMVFEPCGDFQ
jgi:hypothetical protein